MTRAIRVGHIALSFHDAASEQVELVLRSHRHEVDRHAAAKLYIGNALLARLDEALRKRSFTVYTDFSAGN